MADEKISAMTPATECDNADVAPFVQGGANVKVTRELILSGGTGEDILVKAATGQSVTMLGPDGSSIIEIDAGNTASIIVAGDVQLEASSALAGITITSGGSISIQIANGQNIVIKDIANATTFVLDSFAAQIALTCSNGVFASYKAAVSGNWPSGVPTDVAAALDKLAVAVFTLSGGTLP